MSIELIGRVQAPIAIAAVNNVFARLNADPKYKLLSEHDSTLRGQFRSLVHTAPEREDFELVISGTCVVLSCYAGTLQDIEAAQHDVERLFASEGVAISLEEE